MILYFKFIFEIINMDGEKNNNFEDLNIFNEITQNSTIKGDSSIIKNEKDVYDYLSFYTGVFKIANYLLFIVLLVFSTYIFIQKSESFYQSPYLNLLCPLFLWSEANDYIAWENCSSIKTYNEKITNDLNAINSNHFNKIVEIIPKIYELTSSNTKEKDFLVSKTRDRLKVLNIIEEFEKMKSEYVYNDKNKIICKDIVIDSKNTISANCNAYSTEWDEIVWYEGMEKVRGTSISVAVSFLNYIQTKSNKFTLLNKQKSFSQEATNFDFYIYKTSFDLEMKYNWDNLSF